MWLIGGIESEHILVIGVMKQCPAEGFLPKKVRPAQWPVQWKIFAPNRVWVDVCVCECVRACVSAWVGVGVLWDISSRLRVFLLHIFVLDANVLGGKP